MTDNPKTMTAEAQATAWDLVLFFKDHGAKFENYHNAKRMVMEKIYKSLKHVADQARKEGYEIGKADGKLALEKSYERGVNHARDEVLLQQAQALRDQFDAGVTMGFNNGLKCEYRHKVGDSICPECSMQGFEQAREMAAKVSEKTDQRVDHFYSPHLVCKAIADQIRALQPPREGAEHER